MESGFRYAQFCPLARASEILGERWTLLILRELFVGPQRFSDLRRRLIGVSPSVLTARLERLEALELIERRSWSPPSAARVYALSASGRALEPALLELIRWGMRFLEAPEPGDHLEPDWLVLGLRAFARPGPTPPRSFEVRVHGAQRPLRIAGGPEGTRIEPAGEPADVRLAAAPLVLMGLLFGQLDGATALREGQLEAKGDLDALSDLSRMFAQPPERPRHAQPQP
ncbi:MAG: winged helix-turn-helix transcriptional regulator [Proteobacteria bacterium]|nr:winged helix-turn-helix transcriptional regulator [Pseudomonadota bacterium]